MSKGSPSIFERINNHFIYLKISRQDAGRDFRKQSNKTPSRAVSGKKADQRAARKAAKAEKKALQAAAKAAEKAEKAAKAAESAAAMVSGKAEISAAEKRAKAADKAVTEGVSRAKAAKPVSKVNAPELPFDSDIDRGEQRSTFVFTVDHAAEKLRDKPNVSENDTSVGGLDFMQVMDELETLAASIGEDPDSPRRSSFAFASRDEGDDDSYSHSPSSARNGDYSAKSLFDAAAQRVASEGAALEDSHSRKDVGGFDVSGFVSSSRFVDENDDKNKPYIYVPPKAEKKSDKRISHSASIDEIPAIKDSGADKTENIGTQTALVRAREKQSEPKALSPVGRGLIIAFSALLVLMFGTAIYVNILGNPKSDIRAYTRMIEDIKSEGDRYYSYDAVIQGDYFYGAAGSAATSMRCAVDNILYLRGEGVSPSDVSGDLLADWEQIERISTVSAYPYIFQSVVYQLQGMYNSAAACRIMADERPCGLDKDADFTVLGAMDIEELRSLRQELVSIEDSIYSIYTPDLSPKDLTDSLEAAQAALAENPFDGDGYYACAIAALEKNKPSLAAEYVNYGLLTDGNHEGLTALCDVINAQFAPAEEAGDNAANVGTVSSSDVSASDVSPSTLAQWVDYSRIKSQGGEEYTPITLELAGTQFDGQLVSSISLSAEEVDQVIVKTMQITGMSEGILSTLVADVNRARVPDNAADADCAAILAAIRPADDEDFTGNPMEVSSSDVSGSDVSSSDASSSDTSASDVSPSDGEDDPATVIAQAMREQDERQYSALGRLIDTAGYKLRHAASMCYFDIRNSGAQYLEGKENTDLQEAFSAKRRISEFYIGVNDEIASMLENTSGRQSRIIIDDTAQSQVSFYGSAVPVTWTVTATLIRDELIDGIDGSYVGDFTALASYDMTAFDSSFGETFKKMNGFASFWAQMSADGMTLTDTAVSPTVISRTITNPATVATLSDGGATILLSLEGSSDSKSVSLNHAEKIVWKNGDQNVAFTLPVTAGGASISYTNNIGPMLNAGYEPFIGENGNKYTIGWDGAIWGDIDLTQPAAMQLG